MNKAKPKKRKRQENSIERLALDLASFIDTEIRGELCNLAKKEKDLTIMGDLATFDEGLQKAMNSILDCAGDVLNDRRERNYKRRHRGF